MSRQGKDDLSEAIEIRIKCYIPYRGQKALESLHNNLYSAELKHHIEGNKKGGTRCYKKRNSL
jgi:hypothetical protein